MSVCAKFQLSSWSRYNWKVWLNLLFRVAGWVAGWKSGIKANISLSLSWSWVYHLNLNLSWIEFAWIMLRLSKIWKIPGGWVGSWIKWKYRPSQPQFELSWIEMRLSLAIKYILLILEEKSNIYWFNMSKLLIFWWIFWGNYWKFEKLFVSLE